MEMKWIWTIIGVLILAGGIFFFYNNSKTSFSEGAECERISYNGDPSGKINIVFFTNGVSKDSLQEYVNYFESVSPFSENKELFNFFYLDYKPKCKIDVGLLCYSRELIEMSAKCPNEFIVVISDEDASVRSSAYMNVISMNSNLPKSVLTHEFAHVFANLADEYIPASIPFGSKNCASNCVNFGGIGGCFEGCSKENFFRSSENSVMRTLSSEKYFEFNENIIKQVISEY